MKMLYCILNGMQGVVRTGMSCPGLISERNEKENVAYSSLESRTPLHRFDIVGLRSI
jgi:hypothetical protein